MLTPQKQVLRRVCFGANAGDNLKKLLNRALALFETVKSKCSSLAAALPRPRAKARRKSVSRRYSLAARRRALRMRNLRELLQNFLRNKKLLAWAGSGATVVAALVVVLCLTVAPVEGASDPLAAEATPSPLAELADAPATIAPTPEPTPEPILLKKDVDGPMIAQLQQRLMDLEYMEQGEPTEHFGPATESAVIRFQIKNELEPTGQIDNAQWALLNSSDAKKFSLVIGMEGEDIASMQERLRDLGYLEAPATGYFGTDTQAAIRLFQEKNGLSVDGNAGEATTEKLYSEDVKANFVGYGAEGDAILEMQKKLQKLGYLTTEPDGKYGSDTVNAVKRFQTRNGLIADGYYGYDTRQLLNSGEAESNALIIGMSGSDVTAVQTRLVELNYMVSATGYYGSGTSAAVARFQKRNGLESDGKVGRLTMNALLSDDAVKNDGKPSNTGWGSSGGGGSSVSSDVSRLISVARSKMGKPYVLGAKGPNKFDCSGFVYWCLKEIGANQGYMTATTWRNSSRYKTITKKKKKKKGDIICFTPHHVGIVIGGGKMIHCAPSQGGVGITSYENSNYYRTRFVNGKRVL